MTMKFNREREGERFISWQIFVPIYKYFLLLYIKFNSTLHVLHAPAIADYDSKGISGTMFAKIMHVTVRLTSSQK